MVTSLLVRRTIPPGLSGRGYTRLEPASPGRYAPSVSLQFRASFNDRGSLSPPRGEHFSRFASAAGKFVLGIRARRRRIIAIEQIIFGQTHGLGARTLAARHAHCRGREGLAAVDVRQGKL